MELHIIRVLISIKANINFTKNIRMILIIAKNKQM